MNNGFLGIPPEAWYPMFAFALFLIALAFIPRKHMRMLFLESLVWGFFASLVYLASGSALGLFHYRRAGPFAFLGSPIWLNLAWIPAILIFLYFKPPMKKPILFWSYLLLFSLMSAMVDTSFLHLGVLEHFHWSPAATSLVAVFWYLGASIVNERYIQHDDVTTD